MKEEKVKEIIDLVKSSFQDINYINEFPCLEFGNENIVKFEDICSYLNDFINNYKNMKIIIDSLEKDKEKNEMEGIKAIYSKINNYNFK